MEMLTVKEVAEIVKVDIETVYRWLWAGRLKGTKVASTSWRIDKEDLQALFDKPK